MVYNMDKHKQYNIAVIERLRLKIHNSSNKGEFYFQNDYQ